MENTDGQTLELLTPPHNNNNKKNNISYSGIATGHNDHANAYLFFFHI